MQKKVIRLNTGLVYKQQKYNLLREETEGYSKLLVVLNNMPLYPHDCSQYVANVCSIVGQFDLDPNRVLDVVLDVFEQNPLNLSFVSVLEQFKRETIVHMLGFKFTFYHENNEFMNIVEEPAKPAASDGKKSTLVSLSANGSSKIRDVPGGRNVPATAPSATPVDDPQVIAIARPKAAPASLYALAATLVMSSLITIQDLSTYLQPSVEVCAEVTKSLEEEAVRQVSSFGVINLNAKQTASSDKDTKDSEKDTRSVGLVRESSFATLSVEVSTSSSKDISSRNSAPTSRLPLAPALGGVPTASGAGGRPPPPVTPFGAPGAVTAF
eukprot:gene42821-53131_t